MSSSFRGWLLEQQQRSDRTGKFARELTDECLGNAGGCQEAIALKKIERADVGDLSERVAALVAFVRRVRA